MRDIPAVFLFQDSEELEFCFKQNLHVLGSKHRHFESIHLVDVLSIFARRLDVTSEHLRTRFGMPLCRVFIPFRVWNDGIRRRDDIYD